MTLYLKYRPQAFADVVGQDHVVTTLEQAAARDRLSHAYLLCGTRGTGKTSVARILAKTILLKGTEDENIRKQMVKAIEDGSFVDLIEIDAASNRRIDDVRDLIEKIGFSPAVSKAKVYIIDEVHMLTKEAFNALLKTLEEPPEYAYFILATTELHKVPDTIQSRCQRFLFRRVKDDDVIRRLQYIVDQERIVVDREALRAIARHANGSFRDGISLLDQLRSLEKITAIDVTERVGKSGMSFVDDLVSALAKKDAKVISNAVQAVEEANLPLDVVTSDFLTMVREEMHAAIDEKEDPTPFVRMTDILLTALKNIRLSPVPGLVLESAMLELAGLVDSKILVANLAQAAQAKTPLKEAKKEKLEHIAEVKAVEADVKSALTEAADFTVKAVLSKWEEILKNVNPPSVRMSLKDATVAGVEGSTLLLSFPSTFHKDKVADTKSSRNVEEVLDTIFKKPIRIKCLLERDLKPVDNTPDTDLVEAAAEVFGSM